MLRIQGGAPRSRLRPRRRRCCRRWSRRRGCCRRGSRRRWTPPRAGPSADCGRAASTPTRQTTIRTATRLRACTSRPNALGNEVLCHGACSEDRWGQTSSDFTGVHKNETLDSGPHAPPVRAPEGGIAAVPRVAPIQWLGDGGSNSNAATLVDARGRRDTSLAGKGSRARAVGRGEEIRPPLQAPDQRSVTGGHSLERVVVQPDAAQGNNVATLAA
mmetsp:Transcript_15943/g.64300  ORF Transcript_15943/g.64300 Transcript_15943/m.64300 type:complete len:216 (+) Transcript_15943:1660-2307(+)